MLRRRKLFILVFAIMLGAFLYGLARLFSLGFQSGEVYPVYSSFRSDPLGVKALYKAMDSLPGISARRNTDPITDLAAGPDTAIIFCGSRLTPDREETVESLEAFAAAGGRIVIALYPLKTSRWWKEFKKKSEADEEEKKEEESLEKDAGKDEKDPQETDKENEEEPADDILQLVSLAERWGFETELIEGITAKTAKRADVAKDRDVKKIQEKLPKTVAWPSRQVFKSQDQTWKVRYTKQGRPVIMERSFGKGSIVLCSGSYFMSNEAMREDRHPRLLAWLFRDASHIVFDEYHLGVMKPEGVMTLARQYRLHGILGVFVFLAVLFVWKNAAGPVPKQEKAEVGPSAEGSGKDSSEGLVNLLRRSVPKKDILATCVQEYKTSSLLAGAGEDRKERIKEVLDREASRPEAGRDPAGAYRRIATILVKRQY